MTDHKTKFYAAFGYQFFSEDGEELDIKTMLPEEIAESLRGLYEIMLADSQREREKLH
jgi:hypothetical protein